MTDNDLETIYKSAVAISHFAGLREVYDAGYEAGVASVPNALTPDPSLTQAPPTAEVIVSAV